MLVKRKEDKNLYQIDARCREGGECLSNAVFICNKPYVHYLMMTPYASSGTTMTYLFYFKLKTTFTLICSIAVVFLYLL